MIPRGLYRANKVFRIEVVSIWNKELVKQISFPLSLRTFRIVLWNWSRDDSSRDHHVTSITWFDNDLDKNLEIYLSRYKTSFLYWINNRWKFKSLTRWKGGGLEENHYGLVLDHVENGTYARWNRWCYAEPESIMIHYRQTDNHFSYIGGSHQKVLSWIRTVVQFENLKMFQFWLENSKARIGWIWSVDYAHKLWSTVAGTLWIIVYDSYIGLVRLKFDERVKVQKFRKR